MTVIPTPVLDRLREAPAGPGGLRIAHGVIALSPLDVIRAGHHLFSRAIYVGAPDGGAIGGLGTAARLTASGPDRFDALQSEIEGLSLPSAHPLPIGFSYADQGPHSEAWSGFSAAEAVLPMVTVVGTETSSKITIAIPAGSDHVAVANLLRSLRAPTVPLSPDLGDHVIESHPHVSEWRTSVAEAVAAIRGGAFRKVVLARSVLVRSAIAADPFDLVHHLAAANSQCHVFGWQAGEATFIGATPELLVEVTDGDVRSNPLAGSARRGKGDDEDRRIGEALLASDKDRMEHAFVADHVTERLGRFSSDLDVPGAPSLRRVATVQHLSTDVRGTLDQQTNLLEIVAALHPTPAVGGTPLAAATAFIDKVEAMDRGWYSGGIGWVDGSGNGSVALGLRSALVRGTTARLYAGNGIVAESDPEAELIETRLKFRPLLELLAAS